MKIFFRLGRNVNLAYAELIAYLKLNNFEFSVVDVNINFTILEFSQKISIEQMLEINSALGGTIKIGLILGNINSINDVQSIVEKYLQKYEGKKIFGFSVLDIIKQFTSKELNNLGMTIKSELGPARFVTSKEKELSSVIVKKEKLLRKGGEFIFLNTKEGLQLGVTKTVQDFEDYGKKDYGRPKADPQSGMLPPKVAKMMINLLQINDKEKKILDPFCGSGTILQELLLKGYVNILGADISEKAIDDTKSNLEWLGSRYNVDINSVKLFNIDAKEIAQHLDVVDAIVTEPFLGPPLRGGEKKDKIIKVKDELEIMYMRAFKTFSKIIKKNGMVAIIVPAFKHNEEIIYLDILHKIKSYGFTLQTSYKNLTNKKYRSNLMYFRPDAKVLREIMVFKKD